jgi:WD40 repeat protein
MMDATVDLDTDSQLQDGFQEIFTFKEHRLQLRGFRLVEYWDDVRRKSDFNLQQHYVSWDVKQILLWRHDFQPNASPKLLHQVKFSNQPNFISAIVYVPKLKVFLASALDRSFKIFDKFLKLLESIHHEERAILQLEFDSNKDLIYSSGASGITVWRLYRNISLDKAHIMEKLYSFEDSEKWITNMVFEPQFNRIYAIKERSVQVLSISRRSVITTLVDVHEAPVNVVCWYERNQFYLTGCR